MRTILYRSYGEPASVLELADVPDLPAPAGNEVLIRVLSRPVHPGDLRGAADPDAGQAGVPVVSTAGTGWQERVRVAAKGKPIRAVLDCVGGDIASDLLAMLGSGGTFISYGDLTGEPLRATALSFSVRNLRIHGVSVGGWAGLPDDIRAKDIGAAISLAQREPALFRVAASYDLADVAEAVSHSQRAGKGGAVLLTSR